MIDAIRATKIGLDRGLSGVLESVSAYCFKHPPIQMSYTQAKEKFLQFINGEQET
jgi:myo-inositol-1-phosphate synthase